jgi:hypothetical protein
MTLVRPDELATTKPSTVFEQLSELPVFGASTGSGTPNGYLPRPLAAHIGQNIPKVLIAHNGILG